MTTDAHRRFWSMGTVTWALLSLLSITWSLATPIAAAPDEPSHIIKATAVVRGEFLGTPTPSGEVVRVPAWAVSTQAQTCFAFHPETNAACAGPNASTGAITVGVTSAGLYNPTYYLLIGWPSLWAKDVSGVYAMRIVAALLISLMTAAGFALLATWRAPVIPIVGAVIATTPMAVFLVGVINPSSLENAAAFAAFAAILTLVTQAPTGRHLTTTCAVLLVATAIGVNVRGLSVLWFVIALLPLCLLRRDGLLRLLRERAVLITSVIAVLAAAAAVTWVLVSGSLSAGMDTPPPGTPGVGESPIRGFLMVLTATFEYDQGLVGVFGWLDSPAHPATFAIWAMFIGGLLVAGGLLLRRRRLALMTVLLALLVLLPPILQAIYITRGGIIWQGRYALPLLTFLMLATGALVAERVTVSRRLARRLAVILGGLWALGQLLAFLSALKRYAVGADHKWAEMLHPAWAPPGGVVVAVAFATSILAVTFSLTIIAAHRVHLNGVRKALAAETAISAGPNPSP